VKGIPFKTEGLFNISLHCLSFFLIAFSGDKLKSKITKQEELIRELEESKLRMQGYERLYRIGADLAHELRNPLTTISASVQFLKEGKNEKDIIEMISSETERLKELVNDFLFFSRPNDAPKEEVDLIDIIKMIIGYSNHNKNISFNAPKSATVLANRTFFEVALNNIIKNAIEAAKNKIRISIEEYLSEITSFSENRYIVIKVEDDGSGIENGIKNKIFEPFFTTKERGTGLGLAIAHRIITEYGGNILAERSDLGGAKFSLILPVLYFEK
jgi:signal transduction histidine kinase